ncbi:MAG: hypothetical protein J6I61_03825 [Prevotella sp.]|nr:hypothetical protein [Prevotella sp.]
MLIISILLVVLYVGITIWRRWRSTDVSDGLSERLNEALPDSISAMVYDLPRGWQWLWIVWMWVVSLLTCIPLIEAMPDDWRILAFAALACLMLCGAMPISDGNVSRRAHNVFGILGGIITQVCVAFISPWWLSAWCIFPAVVMLKGVYYTGTYFNGKGVLLAEMICYLTLTCASLLTRLAAMS